MPSRRRRSLGGALVVALLCAVQAGCGIGKDHVDQSLLAHRRTPGGSAKLAELYVVRFPDVLKVQVDGCPSLSGERAVNVEGKIEVAPGDGIRVEGKTTTAIIRLLADHLNQPEDNV